MTVRLSACAAALVAVVVFTAACDGGEPTGGAPTDEAPNGTPAVEGTGLEQPAPGGNPQPAIQTAGLPVGGVIVPYGDEAPGMECVSVRWRGEGEADLVDGIQVKITEMSGGGAGMSGVSCGGRPGCDGFTFTSQNRNCSVVIRSDTGNTTLSVAGEVNCSLTPQRCEAFARGMTPRPIQLTRPPEVAPTEETSPDMGETRPGETAPGDGTGPEDDTEPGPAYPERQPPPTE